MIRVTIEINDNDGRTTMRIAAMACKQTETEKEVATKIRKAIAEVITSDYTVHYNILFERDLPPTP